MAPSAVVKHRFQNSLDMIAARSMRTVDRSVQSGTGNAWCIMDSPTLGKMSSTPVRADTSLRLEESTMATGSRIASQAVSVAPLNVRKKAKKIRRRGLISGVHLELPPSPIPTPSPPHTSITFTAEWDWSEKSFVFTSSNTSCPLAPTTTQFMRDSAPIPVNVDEDYFSYSPALSTPSVYTMSISNPNHPSLSGIQTTWVSKSTPSIASRSTSSPDSSNSSPSTPVSPIFDTNSIYSHGRKSSQSTVASSETGFSDDAPTDPSKKDALNRELSGSALPCAGCHNCNHSDCKAMTEGDLLLTPQSAFEQMLYQSMETEPHSIRRPATANPIIRPSIHRRPLPDVPTTAKSSLSIYSPDPQSCFSPVSPLAQSAWPARSSLRQQIRVQIRRTLFNTRSSKQ